MNVHVRATVLLVLSTVGMGGLASLWSLDPPVSGGSTCRMSDWHVDTQIILSLPNFIHLVCLTEHKYSSIEQQCHCTRVIGTTVTPKRRNDTVMHNKQVMMMMMMMMMIVV